MKQILFCFVKFQCRPVHAVSQAGGFRPVIEDMPEVPSAGPANYFCAGHTVTFVGNFFDIARRNRLEKARPARAGIVFVVRTEKGSAASCAYVRPLVFIVIVRMRKRSFGPFFKQYEALLPR